MRRYKGRMIAAGILCSLAATVAVWSGPLAAASGDLHSNAAPQVQAGSAAPTTGR